MRTAPRFAGMDAALRMNLSDALSDKLDQQILNGTEGLLNPERSWRTHNVIRRHDLRHLSVYAEFAVWPRWTEFMPAGIGEVRVVVGSGDLTATWPTQFRSTNAGDRCG